jgi:hypothetical protein
MLFGENRLMPAALCVSVGTLSGSPPAGQSVRRWAPTAPSPDGVVIVLMAAYS